MTQPALSIMQPYVFPYIGYFHLINATNHIVFYDDVNYLKKGWINRNRILINGSEFMFTVPIEKASQNKLINESRPLITPEFKKKFFAQIETGYRKAPYYENVLDVLQAVFSMEYSDVADLAISSITSVYNYLGKDLKWSKSSVISPATRGMDKADRLIQISKDMGYANYINANGGRQLYNKEYFSKRGIELGFIKSHTFEYSQNGNAFVPGLSIIDVMMFNGKEAMIEQFSSYIIE